MTREERIHAPTYNDGSLNRGQRYACGCIQGLYNCGPGLWCSKNPQHQPKIAAHLVALRNRPGLDHDLFKARFRGSYSAPEECSCHINPPCSYCLEDTDET